MNKAMMQSLVVYPLLMGIVATAYAGNEEPPRQERWSDFLPFMAEEARSRGYDLPRPLGFSMIYNYIARDIDVRETRIGVNGAPPSSINKFVDLSSNSRVNAALGRFDVWLLPFMNVYMLGGNLNNRSTTDALITIPNPIPGQPDIQRRTQIETGIDGFVGGGGITLAGGYQSFFLSLDANYTQTDMGFDDRFRAAIVSMRTGWHGRFGEIPTRLWVGGMYWDTENTATSTIDFGGGNVLTYEADQGPAHPWNMNVGTSMAIRDWLDFFVDYGFNFNDVQFLAAGLSLRM